MNQDPVDVWQRCLSPTIDHWQRCRQHMRTAAIRRAIANDLPLFLAPTVAAYLASQHEITRTQIGIVTVPMPTVHNKILTFVLQKGE